MVKIFGFEKSKSGCDWYRCTQPLIQIRAHKAGEVRLFHKGNDFDWFASQEAADKLNEDLTWADVLFIPRLCEPRLMNVLKEFQKMGKKIVSEWDDNFMCVNPLTQQYSYFGQEEYSEEIFDEKTGRKRNDRGLERRAQYRHCHEPREYENAQRGSCDVGYGLDDGATSG